MPAAQPPRLVSAAAVRTILAAAGRSKPVQPEMLDGLQDWLSGAIERAVSRANEKPLTKDQIQPLKDALDSFRKLTDAYRNRQDGPPRINTQAWQSWFDAQDNGRKRGAPSKCDWMLIADLLAIYEVTSGQKVSAARDEYRPGYHTALEYLGIALPALETETAVNMGVKFHVPKIDIFIKQVPKMRARDIAWSKISIENTIIK